jgi:hypothetical protein
MHDRSPSNDDRTAGQPRSRRWIFVFLGFAVIAGALLLTEHRAHVLGVLVYLPILACPLMHLFMHQGHGEHVRDAQRQDGETTRSAT